MYYDPELYFISSICNPILCYIKIHSDARAFFREATFSKAFATCFVKAAELYDENMVDGHPVIQELRSVEKYENPDFDLRRLFQLLQAFCGNIEKPVVLMIDEIDSAQNNQVFPDFLAQLRNYYLERESAGTAAFQSVSCRYAEYGYL